MVCAQQGLSARHRDGRELQRRAAPAHALPGRGGRAHARRREGHRECCARRSSSPSARVVPLPAVRERGERRHSLHDDGEGDPRGFPMDRSTTGCTGFGTGGTLKGVARVLREQSPRPSIVVTEPDNSPMLGSGIAQPLRRRRRSAAEPSGLPPASGAGLVARLHPEARGGRARAGPRRSVIGRERRGRAAPRARARAQGRHLLRHLERRGASPARWPSARAPRRERTCSACCPTRASAT